MRNRNLDLLKIIACLMVIAVHVGTLYGMASNPNEPDYYFTIGNIFHSFPRTPVPLFVMISGAFLLANSKNKNVKSHYKKTFDRIILPTFWFSLGYTILSMLTGYYEQGSSFDFLFPIKSWILGWPYYHMWYMFMIAGLYAVTPFLRLFVKKKNSRLVLLFIVLSVGVQFTVPVLEGLSAYISGTSVLIALINKFKLDFFCGYAVYYMLGWYIVHVGFPKAQKYLICAAGIISVILTVLYVRTTHDYGNAYDNLNLFILLYASGVMILLSGSIRHELSTKTKKALILLSRMSFGVYIIHPLLITIAKLIVPYHAQPLRYMLLLYLVVVCLSFLICYLFSKVPLARKLVRM